MTSAMFLLMISFGVLFPFLQSIGWLYDLGGHGLGNVGYLIFGVFSGAILGVILSAYVVFKKENHIRVFYKLLIVFTAIATSIVFVGVNYFGVGW